MQGTGHTAGIPSTQATDAEVAALLAALPVTTVQSPAGTEKTALREVIGTVVGPNPYAAGGVAVDLSARFSGALLFVSIEVDAEAALLPPVLTIVTLNSPGNGKFKIKLLTAAATELAALDISGATFRYRAVGPA